MTPGVSEPGTTKRHAVDSRSSRAPPRGRSVSGGRSGEVGWNPQFWISNLSVGTTLSDKFRPLGGARLPPESIACRLSFHGTPAPGHLIAPATAPTTAVSERSNRRGRCMLPECHFGPWGV